MSRVFNTAGPCLEDRHYMIPPERRLTQVRPIVEGAYYFVLFAPRQTGKTTLLRSLSRALTAEGRYAAITTSLESYTGTDLAVMMPQILWGLEDSARHQLPPELMPPPRAPFSAEPHVAIKAYLSAWSAACPRPLVVFLDEVDALPGELLLSVLRQIRDGYTSRPAPFPHSLALVGLRDVRDYKIRLRPDGESLGTASPFNIKVRSLELDTFTEEEVNELLSQHTAHTGQRWEPDALAEVWRQSRGQPWLVNALAAQLVTDFDALVPDRQAVVTRAHVLEAREILIERRDTHLDSLADRLKEDRVRRIMEPILLGDVTLDHTFNDDFLYAKNLGLVTQEEGKIRIANPIYAEIIPRALSSHVQMGIPDEPAWYRLPDGTLDLPKLIQGFVAFWRRHGEVLLRGMPYQEAAPHLVFMAYLQRIVNAGGRIERELAVGTGRADLVVELGCRTDIIELKLHRGRHSLPEGLEQVARYATRLGRDRGYLVIFDPTSDTPFEERGTLEEILQGEVTVTVLRA